MLFEEAVADILHVNNNTYYPEIYKGFCYNGSYLGRKDFYDLNLSGVAKAEGEFINDPNYDTDFPPYLWQDRLRLPVTRSALSRTLNCNLIYNALRAHFSQGIIHNAKRIINSDQVFWRRLTTSLSYQAQLTVSSGNGQCLTDFKLADCDDIYALPCTFSGTWIPDATDYAKRAVFTFHKPQTISRVVLYGNSTINSRVLEGSITLSNNFTIKFGPLKEGSKATFVDFPTQNNITTLAISLEQLQGSAAGLNEIEIYSTLQFPSLLNFIKIMVDDTFAYEYLITAKTKEVSLNIYSYGSVSDYKLLSINNDDFQLQNNKITFGPSFKQALIRVETKTTPDIYDQIVIRRVSTVQILLLKATKAMDMLLHRIEHITKNKYQKWTKGYPY